MALDINPNEDVDAGIPRSTNLPVTIIDQGLMSTSSLASDCFIQQQFSNKLQAFMVGYVNAIFSNYSIYK